MRSLLYWFLLLLFTGFPISIGCGPSYMSEEAAIEAEAAAGDDDALGEEDDRGREGERAKQ